MPRVSLFSLALATVVVMAAAGSPNATTSPAPAPPAPPAAAPSPAPKKEGTVLDKAGALCGKFASLVSKQGKTSAVYEGMTGSDSVAVFCPEDAAFDSAQLALSSLSSGDVGSVLAAHVANASFADYTALTKASGRVLSTKDAGKDLKVAAAGGVVSVSPVGAAAAAGTVKRTTHPVYDCSATNGCVFVVSDVLFPAGTKLPTVADVLNQSGAYASLYAALEKESLLGLLGDATAAAGYTVLAPTNKAMLSYAASHSFAVNGTTVDLAKAPATFNSTLKFHILNTTEFELNNGKGFSNNFSTLDGTANVSLTFNKTLGQWKVAGKTAATVLPASRIQAGNGFVWEIDAVMEPAPPAAKKGLTTGAIVAIVIGSVAGLICIAALIYNFTKTRQEHLQDGYAAVDQP